jgi:hypothetical protein
MVLYLQVVAMVPYYKVGHRLTLKQLPKAIDGKNLCIRCEFKKGFMCSEMTGRDCSWHEIGFGHMNQKWEPMSGNIL